MSCADSSFSFPAAGLHSWLHPILFSCCPRRSLGPGRTACFLSLSRLPAAKRPSNRDRFGQAAVNEVALGAAAPASSDSSGLPSGLCNEKLLACVPCSRCVGFSFCFFVPTKCNRRLTGLFTKLLNTRLVRVLSVLLLAVRIGGKHR